MQTKESKLAPKKHFSLFQFKFKNSNSVLWLGSTLLVTSYWLQFFLWPPFLPSKAFQFQFKLSLSQTLLWTTTLPPIGHTYFSLRNSINITITQIYISTYFLDGETVQISPWLALLKVSSRRLGRHHGHIYPTYSLYCNLNILNEN